ncbi:MAG: ribonuclease Z [Bacteroidetes bacterium]|nr:ribonuclease Z [Bacteroidota bacterium]
MKITILGNNSALPAFGRYPTAQIVDIQQELFLMDCGEAAQMRMKQYDIRSHRINNIFISHAHGDHYFGLVGFISSMSLLGREKKLHIYCNSFIKKVIELQIPWNLGFEIEYRFLEENEKGVLLSNEKYEVSCFPVYHSVPTHGFLFVEKKRKRILLPERVQHFEIPKYYYSKLTEGYDYIDKNNRVITNEEVTVKGLPFKRYAFCADTIFSPSICEDLVAIDLLYHEATYLQDQIQKAKERFHSTAMEAAEIAKMAQCKKLIIGHFSSKYRDLNPFLEQAKSIFENTELAIEGSVFEI